MLCNQTQFFWLTVPSNDYYHIAVIIFFVQYGLTIVSKHRLDDFINPICRIRTLLAENLAFHFWIRLFRTFIPRMINSFVSNFSSYALFLLDRYDLSLQFWHWTDIILGRSSSKLMLCKFIASNLALGIWKDYFDE